ncbi:MAG: hypothetical protein U9O98_06850 [Asgard group archaeon]|nr:hypothetical protein [Asgard group archaeon]
MTKQKVFGLLVNEQKVPYLQKPKEKEHCYLCGFSLKEEEDCIVIFADKEYSDKRKVHGKCLQNHLRSLDEDVTIGLINAKTDELITEKPVS